MRNIFIYLTLSSIFLLGFGGLQTPSHAVSPQRIVIDPGHGGTDKGVTGPNGLTEDRLAMDLAHKLKAALENGSGLSVVLTRTAKQNPSLADRTAVANGLKAVMLLSLHAGGGGEGSPPGFRVYYQDYRLQAGVVLSENPSERHRDRAKKWHSAQAGHLEASRRLAMELDQSLQEVLRQKSSGPIGLPLAVLAGADQPAVLLEVGNLSDPEEAKRLAQDGYRNALTRAIVRGIETWQRWYHERK